MFYPILVKNDSLSLPGQNEIDYIYNKNLNQFKDDYLNKLTIKYEKEGYIVVLPMNSNKEMGCWRWGVETFNKKKDNLFRN